MLAYLDCPRGQLVAVFGGGCPKVVSTVGSPGHLMPTGWRQVLADLPKFRSLGVVQGSIHSRPHNSCPEHQKHHGELTISAIRTHVTLRNDCRLLGELPPMS